MAEFPNFEGENGWDGEFANDLVGCTLLIGLTYVDHNERLHRRKQVFGTVLSVDRLAGIVIRQRSGVEFAIAPALEAIVAAPPGIYRLADETETVENPDYTALLTVLSPLRS